MIKVVTGAAGRMGSGLLKINEQENGIVQVIEMPDPLAGKMQVNLQV